jgi:phage FluMu protein Com
VLAGLTSREGPLPKIKAKSPRRNEDPLYVLCRVTKEPICTCIGTDVHSLMKVWKSNIEVPCPHCKETHTYRVSEAFTEIAISDERMRGGVFSRWA